jgi:hypothetical protein
MPCGSWAVARAMSWSTCTSWRKRFACRAVTSPSGSRCLRPGAPPSRSLPLGTAAPRSMFGQGLCPGSVLPAHRTADIVPAARGEPCLKMFPPGSPAESSLELINAERAYGPYTRVQAELRFAAAGLGGEVDDAWTACTSSPARSGLDPQRQDHTLTIKGDWGTVPAALKRWGQHRRELRHPF